MISYDNEEGEYVCDTYTTEELLRDQIGLDARPEVWQDLDAELPDLTWCKKRFGSGDLAAALGMGWTAFVDIVKHHTRYLFSEPGNPTPGPESFPAPEAFGVTYDLEEGVPPERMLDALGAIVATAKLTRTIDAGGVVFRARVDKADKYFSTATELGPPPPEKASQSNRMSPAGIVMFYGAFDADTAIRETFDPDSDGAAEMTVSVAQFRSKRPLRVLDITNLPPPPSFFGDYELHHGISFLWEFERDFIKPVARDGMEHVEYVPTQIVTEYFRYRFRADGEAPLDGIIWRSSRTGKPACVFFFGRSDCGGDASFPIREPSFQLLESATERIPGSALLKGSR